MLPALTDLFAPDALDMFSIGMMHVYALLWRAGILVTGSDLTSNGQRERVMT